MRELGLLIFFLFIGKFRKKKKQKKNKKTKKKIFKQNKSNETQNNTKIQPSIPNDLIIYA